MENLELAKTPEEKFWESWEIFKVTGDIYDAMEFLHDFEAFDKSLERNDNLEME